MHPFLILEVPLLLLIAWGLSTQVLLPLVMGLPLIPFFKLRKVNREVDRVDVAEAVASQEVGVAERRARVRDLQRKAARVRSESKMEEAE